MSTTPNYTGIANTAVNGRTAYSDVASDGERQVEFKGVSDSAHGLVTAAATPGLALSALNLQEAMNNTLLVTRSVAADSILTIGADTVANAQTLISLFNISSTADRRVLRFTALNTDATYSVSLANTSGTHVSIDIQLNGAADAATQLLFDTNVAPPTASSGLVGVTRTVIFSASSLTADAEVVRFNVLSIGA